MPYRDVAQLYGMQRYLGEIATFSGRWTDFLSAGEQNRLYGSLPRRWRAPEGDFFPGLLPLALAGAAVRRSAERPAACRRMSPPELVGPWRTVLARCWTRWSCSRRPCWVAALLRPGLRLGPLGLGDPAGSRSC